MKEIYSDRFSKIALKDLRKVPSHVAWKLQAWVSAVGHYGLYEMRKIKGYHDELLKGERVGQRSIRLNKAYRAIYVIEDNDRVCFAEIIEVTKHEY